MNKEDITKYIQGQIEKVQYGKVEEIGQVISVASGIIKAAGLQNVMASELVEIQSKPPVLGLALNLEEDEVGVIALGSDENIREGVLIKRTGKILSIPVGDAFIGRVIDPLGNPLDGKGPIKAEKFYPVEKRGPDVIKREAVKKPLHTGITAIDATIPIGRGQRELILGDRSVGKSSIVIDTIINQKNEAEKPICIYVAIGQKKSTIKQTIETLKKHGALEYSIVIASSPADPASFLYLAPYSGTALGEYFMDKGKDALLIYDDLTRHAQAWRQISLLLRRPPGREAYPGDVFYLHSRLLERAAKLNKENGGGSLTSLPIIETQAGDVSAYIPTNVISITDGQIYLDSNMFFKGQRPAISVGTSVSRVGSSAQTKLMKSVAGALRLELAQFRELEAFSEFSGDVDKTTKEKIERGRRLQEILKQSEETPISYDCQAVLIFCGTKGFFDGVKVEDIQGLKNRIISSLLVEHKDILETIKKELSVSVETGIKIEKIVRSQIESI